MKKLILILSISLIGFQSCKKEEKKKQNNNTTTKPIINIVEPKPFVEFILTGCGSTITTIDTAINYAYISSYGLISHFHAGNDSSHINIVLPDTIPGIYQINDSLSFNPKVSADIDTNKFTCYNDNIDNGVYFNKFSKAKGTFKIDKMGSGAGLLQVGGWVEGSIDVELLVISDEWKDVDKRIVRFKCNFRLKRYNTL